MNSIIEIKKKNKEERKQVVVLFFSFNAKVKLGLKFKKHYIQIQLTSIIKRL